MTAIRLSDWAKFTPDQKKAALAEMKPNGAVRRTEAQIAAYEEKFGFPSEALADKLSAKEIQESWEVCEWLLLLDRRERFAKSRASSSR